jgi:integrase
VMVSLTEFVNHSVNLKANDLLMDELKAFIERTAFVGLTIVRNYNQQYMAENCEEKKVKDYYLSRQKSKKLGFVYVVRYRDSDGKIIPSHWSTGTNNFRLAEQFAIENREKLLNDYYKKNEGDNLFKFLADYYSLENEAYQLDVMRGDRKPIREDVRKQYFNFINKVFIPFMKEERGKKSLKDMEAIDITFLQNTLLETMKGQTVNNNLASIKPVFNHLFRYGKIQVNPFASKLSLKRKSEDTGVYELPELKGIFLKNWNDDISYILDLIIYTCGLRNEETNSLKVSDITNSFNGIMFENHFLNVCESIDGKTKNAKRVIPLHPFTYQKLFEYIQKNNKGENDFIFDVKTEDFSRASIVLGNILGYSEKELEEKNIRYYSGRHFFKTMLNAGGLGEDIEELFMGHKTSLDVKKNYNHRDKIGQENLSKKINIMFEIMDKTLF